MELALGVDVSTQSVTAEVRNLADGSLVNKSSTPLPPTHPPTSEHDPAWWFDGLRTVMGLMEAEGVKLGDIVAVGVSGQCHGLVPLDERGGVIRPAKLWNDTTSAPQARALAEKIAPDVWGKRFGLVPNAAHTLSKLAWLAEHEPENFAKIRHVVLPHDYITYRLTGNFATDRSEASGTAYWSSTEEAYALDMLAELFGPGRFTEDSFPKVLGPEGVAGYVTAEASAALGIREGAVVSAGGGDQHCGALGLGMRDGDVIYSLGTSGVMITSSATPVYDDMRWADGVCNTWGGWLPLVCTLNCTKVSDQVADLLGISIEEFNSLGLEALARADSEGGCARGVPVAVPYVDGERSPALPEATATLAGVMGTTSRGDICLATAMGVIFGLVRGQKRAEELGIDTSGRVIATGGGAKSELYRTILARTLGKSVYLYDAPNATSQGAAIQAAAVYLGNTIEAQRAAWEPPLISITEPDGPSLQPYYDRYLALAQSDIATGGV